MPYQDLEYYHMMLALCSMHCWRGYSCNSNFTLAVIHLRY